MIILVEYPTVAEPFVKMMAGKLLANPTAKKQFASYVADVRLAGKEIPEVIAKDPAKYEMFVKGFLLETERMVEDSLKNLAIGRVLDEVDAMVHDLIKLFCGVY